MVERPKEGKLIDMVCVRWLLFYSYANTLNQFDQGNVPQTEMGHADPPFLNSFPSDANDDY